MRSKRIDDATYIGNTYNSLTIISMEDLNGKGKPRRALCKCICGNYTKVALSDLRSGHTKSCGCLRIKTIVATSTTHGLSTHPLSAIYKAMIQRCNNPKNERFADYGGRGITVCEEWTNDISAFFKWAFENGWKDGLEVDRRDNFGTYHPNNCRLVPSVINQRNKRNNKLIEYRGEVKSLAEWCEILGLHYGTYCSRFFRHPNVDPAEIFEKPLGRWPAAKP